MREALLKEPIMKNRTTSKSAQTWVAARCDVRTFLTHAQDHKQLMTPGGAKSFLRGAPTFWTMSNSCPTHFSRGGRKFSRGDTPPLYLPWLRPADAEGLVSLGGFATTTQNSQTPQQITWFVPRHSSAYRAKTYKRMLRHKSLYRDVCAVVWLPSSPTLGLLHTTWRSPRAARH